MIKTNLDKTVHFIIYLFILFSIQSCISKQDELIEYVNEDIVAEFNTIFQKYELEKVKDDNLSNNEYRDLKPITDLNQLKSILNILKPNRSENKIAHDYDLSGYSSFPRLKSGSSEEGGGFNVIVVSQQVDNISRGTVHIDKSIPNFVNSSITMIPPVGSFIAYEHKSGDAIINANRISFSANGEAIVKIIIKDVEIYRFNARIIGSCDMAGGNVVMDLI